MNIAGEISYDLVMENDMSFVEGCFRLPHGVWQVVIISKDDVTSPQIKFTEWDSGIKGVFIQYPQDKLLNSEKVETLLSSIFNIKYWLVVSGPDSMTLR